LEEKLNARVYPFAPADINNFLKDSHFLDDPPEVVVVASVERFICDLDPPKLPRERWPMLSDLKRQFQQTRWMPAVGVFLDRLSKMNMVNYIRAKIGNQKERPVHAFPTPFGTMYFLQGEDANKDVARNQFERAVQTIEAYDRILRQRGIRFIFLPIPNKENIYYQYLPHPKRPTFLEDLIAELKRRKVETIDTQKAFEESYQKKSTLLYRLDDTHWSPEAVRITADLIGDAIIARSTE
jgi:hypothetical protein